VFAHSCISVIRLADAAQIVCKGKILRDDQQTLSQSGVTTGTKLLITKVSLLTMSSRDDWSIRNISTDLCITLARSHAPMSAAHRPLSSRSATRRNRR